MGLGAGGGTGETPGPEVLRDSVIILFSPRPETPELRMAGEGYSPRPVSQE